MSGPPPKPDAIRQRRNKSGLEAELHDDDPIPAGKVPQLAKRRDELGMLIPWSAEIRKWWRDVWRSPMAREWTKADIHGLRMIAELRERYSVKPSAALASEIRLQEARFGLDPISRRRLQWTVNRDDDRARGREQTPPQLPEATGDDPRARLRAVK